MLLIFALVAVFAVFGQCRVNLWRHEPSLAADSALVFAEVALVQHDRDAAHELLLPEFRDEVSAEVLGGWIEAIHPSGYPLSVGGVEYRSAPGYEGMFIFLVGQAGDEMFYYRFQMQGSAPSGYEIAGFWRGTGPYPNPETRTSLRR